MSEEKPAPKRRGPQPKPAHLRSVSVNASLPAAVAARLEKFGDGSASRGLRLLAARWNAEAEEREKNASKGGAK